MIAHRLSTITHSDQILVIGDGEVMERGNHAELLQKHGLYYTMWQKQIRAEKQRTEEEKDVDQVSTRSLNISSYLSKGERSSSSLLTTEDIQQASSANGLVPDITPVSQASSDQITDTIQARGEITGVADVVQSSPSHSGKSWSQSSTPILPICSHMTRTHSEPLLIEGTSSSGAIAPPLYRSDSSGSGKFRRGADKLRKTFSRKPSPRA